jgi:ATP synthase protein I
MAGWPGETGKTGPGQDGQPAARDDDLDRRRRELEAALATRRPSAPEREGGKSGGMSGFGNALRLSSEFIAGVVVGAVLGWLFDKVAGTSPWGLIFFLLLGFGAGVLNVLRSAGLVADAGVRMSKGKAARPEKK